MTTTTRETADHAELAACPFCGGEAKSETLGHGKSARTGVKCADVDCPGSMRLVGPDEDGVAFWNRRPREAALLSEIATLRGELDLWHSAYEIAHDQATANGSAARQAERQRDELRKALSELRGEMVAARNDIGVDDWISFASEALANQGADQ